MLLFEAGDRRPWKVLPRKGRRSVTHEGPCSWIVGLRVKNLSRISVGEEPEMKALQKASAEERNRSARLIGFVISLVCCPHDGYA